MFTLIPQTQGNVVAARAIGALGNADYQQFTGEIKRRISRCGSARVLLDLEDFHGENAGKAWADFLYGLKRLGQLQRCAVVGDKKWEEWLVDLGKPFFKVRYFHRGERERALEWLREPETTQAEANLLDRLGEFAAQHPIASVAASVALGYVMGAVLRRFSR